MVLRRTCRTLAEYKKYKRLGYVFSSYAGFVGCNGSFTMEKWYDLSKLRKNK